MIVTAKKVYTINWDGNAMDYIRLADQVAREHLGERLDSLDFGDATGAFCAVHDKFEDLGYSCYMWKDAICQVNTDWELFTYEGNLDTTTQLKEEDLEP